MKFLWAVLFTTLCVAASLVHCIYTKLKKARRRSQVSGPEKGTCIISAIRISTVHRGLFDTDASWVMAKTVYWSVGEITCAMVCLCIPVLRPLLGGRANLRRWRSGAHVEVVETRGHAHFTLDSTQTWTAPAPSHRTASRGSVRSSRDIEMRENTQDRRHEEAKRTSDPPTTGTESSGAGSTWKSDDSYQRADGSWS
ncbi:hypothetical protein BN1723_000699 [Verticillium longisporum]|uniref:Rhodopsin domain-containing protein n=1 Tax=Verticillium longisporum TaxID=100787 RepID=A0A0G4MYJ4_VERLO|nr:hypothetical protein BN1723_000699 [Verticillium longisporum]